MHFAKVSECFPDCVIISDNSPQCNDTPSHPCWHSYSAMVARSAGCSEAVTPNPVTNCHETFALQESLNRWCQDKFIQTVGMNIIITDYHNSQSVITQHTRPNTPLSVSLRVSGSWTNHSQVSLSPPIRALGGTCGVPG